MHADAMRSVKRTLKTPWTKVFLLAERRLTPTVPRALDPAAWRFLARCLPADWEIRVGSAEGPGAVRDDKLRTMAENLPLITLGMVACRRLHQLQLPHAVIPDPRWARKFGGSRTVAERWYRVLLLLGHRHAMRYTRRR